MISNGVINLCADKQGAFETAAFWCKPGSGLFAYVSKTDEFSIKNEELCIQNEELCFKDEEFCITNEETCIINEELCIKNGEFCRINPQRRHTSESCTGYLNDSTTGCGAPGAGEFCIKSCIKNDAFSI